MPILSITKTQKNVECQVLVVQQEQEDLAAVDEDSEKKILFMWEDLVRLFSLNLTKARVILDDKISMRKCLHKLGK